MTNLLQQDWMVQQRSHFEMALKSALPNTDSRLHQAIAYTTLNGGKRLRPLLVYATGLSFNATIEQLDPAAIAIELIHCYSLVHDDLPAMDDDDLRRGRPSCHKQFDEATAILVGDALQALAFELLSHPKNTYNQLAIIHTLAKASGANGMVSGQSLDMLALNGMTDIAQLKQIHQLKTGALFSAAIHMGALASGHCDPQQLERLQAFSQHLGLAFQIRDDILDVESNALMQGKTTGKDATQNKATYPALIGVTESKRQLSEHLEQAQNYLQRVGCDLWRMQKLIELLQFS